MRSDSGVQWMAGTCGAARVVVGMLLVLCPPKMGAQRVAPTFDGRVAAGSEAPAWMRTREARSDFPPERPSTSAVIPVRRAGLGKAMLIGAAAGAVVGTAVFAVQCGAVLSCGDADAPLPLFSGALGAGIGALMGAFVWSGSSPRPRGGAMPRTARVLPGRRR